MWKAYSKERRMRYPTILIYATDADDIPSWDALLQVMKVILPPAFRVEVQHLAALSLTAEKDNQQPTGVVVLV
jgi:hypothetical protein